MFMEKVDDRVKSGITLMGEIEKSHEEKIRMIQKGHEQQMGRWKRSRRKGFMGLSWSRRGDGGVGRKDEGLVDGTLWCGRSGVGRDGGIRIVCFVAEDSKIVDKER